MRAGQIAGRAAKERGAWNLCADPAAMHLLSTLERLDVRATFFVLGHHLEDRGLLREMVARGHEIGVHGWDHRPVALH